MSSDLWSRLNINQPPNVTCKVNLSDKVLDLSVLSDACANVIQIFKNQDQLHFEAATLSRLIYRMKTAFRSDKGLKCMEKVNRCLRIYLSMDIGTVYQNFFSSLPKKYLQSEVYCPSLQMLEFILVRTQGLSALLCRTVHTCCEAAIFLQSRIAIGHNWPVALTSLSVISRIWFKAQYLLNCCFKAYKTILPYCNVLPCKGATWLPNGYQFPADLQTWLDVPWRDVPKVVEHPNASVDLPYVSQDSLKSHSSGYAVSEDLGEAVSRSMESLSESLPLAAISSRKNKQKYSPCLKHPDETALKNMHKRRCAPHTKTVDCKSKSVQGSTITEEINGSRSASLLDQNWKSPEPVLSSIHASSKEPGKLPLRKKVACKSTTLSEKSVSQKISSLKTESNIQTFLNQEKTSRHFTSMLTNEQWNILHPWLKKQCLKLKKVHQQENKIHIIDKIKRVLTSTLNEKFESS